MMAGKFLSICFALCTVALDAIHMQVGLNRHGAGDKTCQEVVTENMLSMMGQAENMLSMMGQSLLQSASMIVERPTDDTDLMSVNTEAEEEAAPVHQCSKSDWRGPLWILDAVCEKGSESEPLIMSIMSEGLKNASNVSKELANTTMKAIMTTVQGSVTAEQKSACQNFEPKKFIGLFGPNFDAMEECAKKMMGCSGACASCMTNFVKDMIGSSTFAIPFSCGMKCVKGLKDKKDPTKGMKDPECQSCATKNIKKLGICMGGERYETELPKEVKAALSA
jgi:hypothetical protein